MWYLVVFIVAALIAVALTPKPQIQNQTPEQFKVPKTGEGEEIPVLFGTRDVRSPNVVWYGDIKTVAIRKKGGKK